MKRQDGFSLLEVILALALLGGAAAVLGEASRQAMRNAQVARDLSHAELLCESKLSEIIAGIAPATATGDTAFDSATTASIDPVEPAWLYSIETGATDETGLIYVRVTVSRDLPAKQHPVTFSLVRWIPDPNAASNDESGLNAESDENFSDSSIN